MANGDTVHRTRKVEHCQRQPSIPCWPSLPHDTRCEPPDARTHRGSRLIADPAHDEREHRDPYLDATGGLILCHRHQACFEPQQGLCLSGPCTGQRLTALDVTIERPDGSPAQLVLKSRH